MRISDWSSDVCSSDLPQRLVDADEVREARRQIDVPATIFALLPTLIGSHRDIAEQHRRLRVGHAPVIEEPDDRKSVVQGKSVSVRVDSGGGRLIKKKKHYSKQHSNPTQ